MTPRRPPEQVMAIAFLVVLVVLVLAISGMLLAGSAPVPTSSAVAGLPTSTSATSPTSPSAGPSASAEATTSQPSVSPATGSPPASTAPEKLVIKWVNPPGASNLDDLTDIRGYARVGERLVIVGSRLMTSDTPNAYGRYLLIEVPAIWWSDNGTSWQRATLPDGYESLEFDYGAVDDVVAGGTGFVALTNGIPIWSVDGKEWFESTGWAGSIFASRVSSAGVGLIAVGRGTTMGQVIRSVDGQEWAAADDLLSLFEESDYEFVRSGDELYAFIYRDYRTGVWRTADTTNWTDLGDIDGYVSSAAVGPLGWIAAGSNKVWLSGDATTWHRVRKPPTEEPRALIVDSAGYVMTTRSYLECGEDWTDAVGSTWTSVDGLGWRKMNLAWTGRWLDALFLDSRTLIGVGQAHEADDEFGFVRTAELPAVEAAPPTPTPPPTPSPPPDYTC